MPNVYQFREGLASKLARAEAENRASIDIRSGEFHTELGGYPGKQHALPVCCAVMRREMRVGDEVLQAPPSGDGAYFEVRYSIPRDQPLLPTAKDDIKAMSRQELRVPAAVQHARARRALPLIAEAAMADERLTYQSLALDLGEEVGAAREIGQVCDLLDASATLAGRPLMAFHTVRSTGGELNEKAWATEEHPTMRAMLIREAREHRFSQVDVDAIQDALTQLKGKGREKAWEYVNSVVPARTILDRLEGREKPPPEMDSVNDLGTDVPQVILTAGRRFRRDPDVRKAVLKRAAGRCELCGEEGFLKDDGTRYLEAHHIIALAADGEDRLTNVIGLCAGDHRRAHFAIDRAGIEETMQAILAGKAGRGI